MTLPFETGACGEGATVTCPACGETSTLDECDVLGADPGDVYCPCCSEVIHYGVEK